MKVKEANPNNPRPSLAPPVIAAMAAALIAGCGGGDGHHSPSKPAQAQRGSVIGAPAATGKLARARMDEWVDTIQLRPLYDHAQCDVAFHSVEYNTQGGKGEATNATTAVMIPAGDDPACRGPRPLLVYAHGMDPDKRLNLADPDSAESMVIANTFASQGFIVVAPNYTGYDRSRLGYHPYMNAEAQSIDLVDALRAAKSVLPAMGATTTGKLFLAGYSQGGYVAMAAHRAIERDYAGEFTVTGSMPMAGPYALSATVQAKLEGDVGIAGPLLATMLLTAYQPSYGNLYRDPSEMFEAPYASYIANLAPSNLTAEEVEAKLPPNLIDIGDGKPFLLKTATAQKIRDDFRLKRSSPVRDAFLRNDLLDWQPRGAMALCGASQDQVVPFSNATQASAYFASRGVRVPAYDLRTRTSLPAGRFSDTVHEHYNFMLAAYPEGNDHFLAVGCEALALKFFQGL